MKKFSLLFSMLLLSSSIYAADYTQDHTFADGEILTHTLLNTEFGLIASAISSKIEAGDTLTSGFIFSGVATDITTGTDEDLTLVPNGTGDMIMNSDTWTSDETLTISSSSADADLTITSNGTGNINLSADTVMVGDSNANATITTNGTGDLILNTNSGTNSGTITIEDAANGTIILDPNGTGWVSIPNDTYGLKIGPSEDFKLYTTGVDNVIYASGTDDDLVFKINDGGVAKEVINIDGGLPILTSYIDFRSGGAGTYNLGDATGYWGDVSYKTLTDRGCLGWFDEGVEMQDGTTVSDIEAIKSIKKHPTKKTIYGEPMLDYTSMPKVVYKKATQKDENGNEVVLPRDENDEPYWTDEEGEKKPASDGAETTALLSIMLGGIKQLAEEKDTLELRVKKLEDKISILEKQINEK